MGERCGGTAALLTGLGGEVGWALRPKQPLEDGTNLYQKPTPKQDKGGGINPPPRELASVLADSAAGRQNAASLLALLRLLLALNTRETRVKSANFYAEEILIKRLFLIFCKRYAS